MRHLLAATTVALLLLIACSRLPEGEAHLERGELPQALEACASALDASGEAGLRARLCAASAAGRLDRSPERVERWLDEVVARSSATDGPWREQAHTMRVRLAVDRQRWARLLKLTVDDPDALALQAQAHFGLGDLEVGAAICPRLSEAERSQCEAHLHCQIGAAPCPNKAPGLSELAALGLDLLRREGQEAAALVSAECDAAPEPHPGAALIQAHLSATLSVRTGRVDEAITRLWPAAVRWVDTVIKPWPGQARFRPPHKAALETLLMALAQAGDGPRAVILVRLLKAVQAGSKRVSAGLAPLASPPPDEVVIEVYCPEGLEAGVITARKGADARVHRMRLNCDVIARTLARHAPDEPLPPSLVETLTWALPGPLAQSTSPGIRRTLLLPDGPLSGAVLSQLPWAQGSRSVLNVADNERPSAGVGPEADVVVRVHSTPAVTGKVQ